MAAALDADDNVASMSIPVPLDELAAAVSEFGELGYLMSAGDDGRPRINHVRFRADGHVLHAGVGRRTAAALTTENKVSCLWPAIAPGGMSLIADGEATLSTVEDVTTATIAVTWAVRHAPPRS